MSLTGKNLKIEIKSSWIFFFIYSAISLTKATQQEFPQIWRMKVEEAKTVFNLHDFYSSNLLKILSGGLG